MTIDGAKSRDFEDVARELGHETLRASIAAATKPLPFAGRPSNDNSGSIPFEFFSDIEPNLNALWTVKNLIGAGAFIMFYGAPATGKSFLAIDMALHVALGLDWFGRPTRQGGVVYVGAEGQEGIKRRIKAFRLHHNISGDVPFALVPAQLNMLDGDDADQLIEAIKTQMDRLGCRVELVVIDTLSRTFGGGDENTSAMATYVANLGRFQKALGTGLIVVHHAPKDQANDTPRGHGSLLAAVDTCLKVQGGSDPRTVKVIKQKDGEPAQDFTFRLVPVEIGVNADGEAVTSCIVAAGVCLEGMLAGAVRIAPQKMSAGKFVTLRALRDVAANVAADPATNQPPSEIIDRCGTAVPVPLQLWQQEAIARLSSADNKPDSARKAFERNRNSLQAAGLVQVFNQWAWIPAL